MPSLVIAETTQYQINASNVYCVNGSVGPKLFIFTNGNPTQTSYSTVIGQCKSKLKNISNQLKILKPKLKRSPKDKKLKAKQKKLNTDKLFYTQLIVGINDCNSSPPIVTQSTPVAVIPTSVPGPTIAATPTSIPLPTSTPIPTVTSPPVYGSNAIPVSSYYLYEGAVIYASDNQYLGVFSSNKYSTDSIANPYGTYGSKYSTYSVFSTYGTYGSPYSSKSAWSSYTSTPPILIINGQRVAYLTRNTFLSPRIDPAMFLAAVGRVD